VVIEDVRLQRAKTLYERAVFHGEAGALTEADHELDGVEADLALARGRVIHARLLADRSGDNPEELVAFSRAAELYRSHGDSRGEGEALFWVGTYHQVIRQDDEAALPALQRAHELASSAGDLLTLSYVVRHLGFVDAAAGRLAAARKLLEESVRLRRELAFMPGVAAGLLSLAELATHDKRGEDAVALLNEAESVARESDAQGVLAWITQAREAPKLPE
jgi:tetratricopeptide (TPR) repeat protein